MKDFQDYRLGYESVVSETPLTTLSVIGEIPYWLKGNLIRNGPAKYEVGNKPLNHWFDGFAMLHRFSFNEGKAVYLSQFLKSDAYKNALLTGKVSANEFATNEEGFLLENLMRPFTFKATDNSNVNVLPWNDKCLAMTETPYQIIFDRASLDTLGRLIYQDSLSPQIITAHPHFDFATKEIFNIATYFGPVSKYIVFKMSPGIANRKVIAKIAIQKAGYLHSFAMTKNYIVLVEFPLLINPLELLFSGKPYIENYHWHPQAATRLFVIDKCSGNVIGPLEADPCFAFHHVNAFEQNNEVFIDLLGYPDSAIINSLYLANLMAEKNKLPSAQFYRFQIDINKRTVRKKILFNDRLELPRINYKKCNADTYQYAYAAGQSSEDGYLDRLTKVNLSSSKVSHWQESLCFPGEPVLVTKPNSDAEDEGVLLSVVLDVKNGNSFLIILNAQNMQEYARVLMPNIVPFGFHGQFMEDLR